MSAPVFSKLVEGRGREALENGKVRMVVPAFESGTMFWLGVVDGTNRQHRPRVLVTDGKVEGATCTCIAAEHGNACYHAAAVLEVLKEAGELSE